MSGSVLFDEPGPRGRRRIRIASIVTVVVLVAVVVLALRQFASHGQLDADKWRPFGEWPIWEYLLVGLRGTVQAAALVAVLGAAFGLILALGRLSPVRPVRWLATAYIEIARTLPVLLLIYVTLFALPRYGINLPLLWKLVLPLTVANAAAFAEIFRAGILSMPRGQNEAAVSLGMTRVQSMRLVVLPQALRAVAPSVVSQLVSLLKDTSLGYIVAFTELLYRAQVLAAYNHLLVQTYLVVTLVYLVCNLSLSGVAHKLQTFTRRRTAAPVPEKTL
ncbi:amino acid ABC transporter permease [Cryptosporangium aurantiacum]|uniref:Glutamate transport system permease protein n=1 Tax=Cryptosporangium aurantiacum TaxID=134849 RepID=A0A1M7TXZ0_9ACTN|nr:amino acid ABC transporter permease [Cryptosporangium aurantiacum]SHN75560.1 glutamate transport system permease protein [Cryptosporangium aurantiacum]